MLNVFYVASGGISNETVVASHTSAVVLLI